MAVIKSIFGAIALVIYSLIVKFIILLVIFAGVRGGWECFTAFSVPAIWMGAVFSVYPYFMIVEWTKKSRFAVTFAAVIITLWNLLGIFTELLRLSEVPVHATLIILAEIAQIIFVIYACIDTYKSRKEENRESY